MDHQLLFRTGGIHIPLLIALLSLPATTARAAHYSDEGNGCLSCHTVLDAEGDPATKHLAYSSRTLAQVRAYAGGTVPDVIGCTYCHSVPGNTAMRESLSHFFNKASMHPVGRNVFTRANTAGEYLSAVGSSTAGELDCVDCHDPALLDGQGLVSTVGHAARTNPPRSTVNPYMLRSVTAAGQFDSLCRGCHGAAAPPVKGKDVRLVSHGDGAATPLRERDGTSLRTTDAGGQSQCNACHDSHYSGNVRLFNDGKETGEGARAVVGTDCTSLCHYAGDADGGYAAHGHGRAASTYKYRAGRVDPTGYTTTMNMGCPACHLPLDTSDTSPERKRHAEIPTGGTRQENYRRAFNLNLPIQAWDTGTPLGNPIVGVCSSCHASYARHQTGAGPVGCQDCHDEHGEGSGAGSNVFMIPQTSKRNGTYATVTRSKAGTETVKYDTTRINTGTGLVNAATDFYSGAPDAGLGVCDNAECHTVPGRTPLASFMTTGGGHSGGTQAVNADCAVCHKHSGDSGGGWRATDTCNDCHAANGAGHAAAQGKSATTHNTRHGAASAYIGTCSDCHSSNGPGSPDHNNGTVNFGGTFMTAAFSYARGAAFDDAGCGTAANGCHNAEPGAWAANSLGADACPDCHLAAGKALARTPASGLHAVTAITRHDNGLLAGNCVNCHDGAAPSDAHLNGTLDTPATAAFRFHANVVSYGASGCQATGTCHGGGDGGTWRRRWIGVVDAAPGTPGNDTPGQAVCQNCHGDFTGWRWNDADPTTTRHTDPYAGNTGDRMDQHNGCERCHGWGKAAYGKTWKTGNHGNGLLELNGPDATHGVAAGFQYNETTGGCQLACHASAFTMNPASGWTRAYADFGEGDCGTCHAAGGAGPTVVWPAGNAVGRRTGYGSHLGATVAEEANGFLSGLGAWKGQCNKCHNAHSGLIKVPAPPVSWADPSGRLSGTNMRTRLGLTYALETNVSAHVGGTAQGGASEAEFCWGCHDANGVSEWGFNTKTTPAGFPVVTFATGDGNQESENNGWIYTTAGHATKTSAWAQGYWMSPYDANLSRRIASIHSASFDPAGQSSSVAANVDAAGMVNRTAPTLEAQGYLRCSNCHDVHDTFGPDGKPYLRGRATGNPYPPELPPRAGYPYSTSINTLTGWTTPRASVGARDKGGYFIDQNSNWPTNNAALDTLAETAELCTLCHGTDVDGMDFYPGKKLWRPPMINGHSNSTLGGTGANKADLFSALRGDSYNRGMGMQNGQPSTPWVCGFDGLSCDYSYPQLVGCCSCEFDCGNILGSGWYGSDFANWYGAGTIGGAGAPGDRAHKFTCSKCHSPHAAGLPALLTQSCIDPSLGNYTTPSGFSGLNLIANNCHRKTSTNDGWHVLAPGQ